MNLLSKLGFTPEPKAPDPTPPVNLAVCGGCNAIGMGWLPANWILFNFRSLKPSYICPDCQPKWADHCSKLQSQGF